MHAEACLTNVRCHFCEQVVGGLGEGNTRGVQIPAVNLLNLMLSTTEVLPTVFAGLQVCRNPFNKLDRLNAWKIKFITSPVISSSCLGLTFSIGRIQQPG